MPLKMNKSPLPFQNFSPNPLKFVEVNVVM